MFLNFDAATTPPQQPADDPLQFPAYARTPERADIGERGSKWEAFVRQLAQVNGEDGDDAWFAARMERASAYARQDTVNAVDSTPKRPPGRPLLYPMIEGESEADRKKRLALNRRVRAATDSDPGKAAKLLELMQAVEQAKTAYDKARAALLVFRAEARG